MNKRELRGRMRAVREAIDEKERKSGEICRHILSMKAFEQAACVMLYMPIGSEVDVRTVTEEALRAGKRVCLPVCRDPVCREMGRMDAVLYTGEACLKPGAWGIPEPQGEVVEPEEIDLVLCPGLAFDARGGRLGYGKGYYDRYLEKVHAFLAGICYTECIVENVPADEHDMPVQAVVTQEGVLYAGGLFKV